MLRRLLSSFLALFLVPFAAADVTLSPAFRDHAVLQRDQPITVSGRARPGEEVQVLFGDVVGRGTATSAGIFSIELPAQPASAIPRELVVQGKNRVSVSDILVGDVWLCSGQSNMEWTVGSLPEATATVAAATDPQIRILKTPHALDWSPRTTAEGSWTVATGEAVRGCTAIGYFFARELRDSQHVPIGILDLSWGGTKIEPWIPLDGVRRDLEIMGEYNALRNRTDKNEPLSQETPTTMWNAMVAPFSNVHIKGVAWYQGESNAGNAPRYRRSLPLLIEAWRKAFGNKSLPFAVFQLASFMQYRPDLPVEPGWADLRESQRGGAVAAQAGLIVLLDIGDANDIHPARKAEAARRLALWARAHAYGEKVEYSGPVLTTSTVKDGAMILSFDHADGLATRDGKPLGGFAIAGADGKFVWAEATIDGGHVIVRSKEIAAPTQVRYAWHNNPEGANLVNGAGLPAGPFRTDPVEVTPARRR